MAVAPEVALANSRAAVSRSTVLDDRDLAGDLQDCQPDLLDVVDALLASGFEHFIQRHLLRRERRIDRLTIGDEHDWDTFDDVSRFGPPPTDVAEGGDPEP